MLRRQRERDVTKREGRKERAAGESRPRYADGGAGYSGEGATAGGSSEGGRAAGRRGCLEYDGWGASANKTTRSPALDVRFSRFSRWISFGRVG